MLTADDTIFIFSILVRLPFVAAGRCRARRDRDGHASSRDLALQRAKPAAIPAQRAGRRP